MHCWNARSVIEPKVRGVRPKVKGSRLPGAAGAGEVGLALALGGALQCPPLRPTQAVHALVVDLAEDLVDRRLLDLLGNGLPAVAPPFPVATDPPDPRTGKPRREK